MAALALRRPAGRARVSVDLEHLVAWAIRDQRADRDDVALFDAEATAHYGQLAGLPIGAGAYARGFSADGVVSIARKGAVGCKIDGGGAMRGVAPKVHPDAELVASALNEQPSRRGKLLILQHARLGERPAWHSGRQTLTPVKVEGDRPGRRGHKMGAAWEPCPLASEIARDYIRRGIPLVDRYGRRRIVAEETGFRFRVLGDGRRQVLTRWTCVEPMPSLDEIAITNDAYATWHAAMVHLMAALRDVVFADHELTGFIAPAYPWER